MARRIAGVRLLRHDSGSAITVWALAVQAKKSGTEVCPDKRAMKNGSDVSTLVYWMTCIQ